MQVQHRLELRYLEALRAHRLFVVALSIRELMKVIMQGFHLQIIQVFRLRLKERSYVP